MEQNPKLSSPIPLDNLTPSNNKGQSNSTTAAPHPPLYLDNLDASGTVPSESTWKLTIKNADGTMSEVFLERNVTRAPGSDYENGKSAQARDGRPKGKKASPPQTTLMKVYTVCHHCLTGFTSIVIILIMILTLVQFNNSRKVPGAWPKEPLLTPTNVLFAVSVVSIVADAVALGMQCFGGSVASKANTYAGYVKNGMKAIQMILTAVGSGIFKSASINSDKKDLWSYSCTKAAREMQDVNAASTLCTSNRVAWYLSVLNVILHVLNIGLVIFAWWKPAGKESDETLDEAKALIEREGEIEADLRGDNS